MGVLVPVPLENVNKENNTPIIDKKDYYPTWLEWSTKNRENVFISGIENSTGIYDLYTVPEDRDLYLTSLNISAYNGGIIRIYIQSFNKTISFLISTGGIMQDRANFSMPIKVSRGETVYLQIVGATIDCGYSIIGFLDF